LSIKVFSPIQSTEKDKWFNLPVANTVYKFPISILPSKGIVDFKVYEKSDTAVSIAFITFIDSANVAISSHSTINPNTPSANGYSSITLQIPTGAAYFLMGSDNPCYVLAKAGKLEPFPLSTPIKYTTSQNVTITNSANVALLGGGGTAGSANQVNSSTQSRGGGGSGYLTHGSISPGNYSLTIGAGGAPSTFGSNTAPGGTGGTTTFSTFNAAGGVGTGSSTGGAGGSGGGSSGTSSTANNRGGFNGSSSGGTGSGVTANLFIAAPAGGTWPNGAGGVYAGGAGANSSTPLTQQGQDALPNTGGGGGGGKSNSTEGYVTIGGNGGSGALWVLES
jgi:hypothetical protein